MTERVFVSSFGLAAGMVGLYFIERQIAADRRFAARAKPATGQVVDTWVEDETWDSPRWTSENRALIDTSKPAATGFVFVRFTVAPDRPVYFSVQGSEHVGDIIDVIYDPDNPEDARRKGSVDEKRVAERLIVYGWMLLWLGVLLFAGN